jgi:uncharacterized membrane protein HdeD (DUF308 family)
MTWKHVAVFAIAAAVVMTCEFSSACITALPLVIGFASVLAGAAAGNAMHSRTEAPKDKAS